MHSILSTSPAPVAPTPRHATAVGTQPRGALLDGGWKFPAPQVAM
jgi:hypothetical protein